MWHDEYDSGGSIQGASRTVLFKQETSVCMLGLLLQVTVYQALQQSLKGSTCMRVINSWDLIITPAPTLKNRNASDSCVWTRFLYFDQLSVLFFPSEKVS